MARFHGKNGQVLVNGAVVAEVTEWTAEDDRTVVRASPMGSGYVAHEVGQPAWTGTISVLWDPADATGQEALAGTVNVGLALHPEGTGSGLPKLEWTDVVINNVGHNVPSEDWATRTFAWAANSAVDRSAQV